MGEEINLDVLTDKFLDGNNNPEPDTDIYNDPDTFGISAGEQIDKAFKPNSE